MSISSVSSSTSSLIENVLEAASTSTNKQTNQTAANAATIATNQSTVSATDTLTQDIVTLLKALANGNSAQAKIDLAKLKADLKAESTADATGVGATPSLARDVTSLLKDLTTGKTATATSISKIDATKLETELNTEQLPSSYTTTNASPLESLVNKLSDALSSGRVQGALQDLAAYLVQNGQSSGGLVNTSA